MNRGKCLMAAAVLLAGGALFATVDENLPWKWDESGRVPPPAPAQVGSAVSTTTFDSWGFFRVRERIAPLGLVLIIR